MKYNYRNKLSLLLDSGIFGICNNRNKTIYIGYGKNMLKSVSDQLALVKDNLHPIKGSSIDVFIIESCDPKWLKIRQTYWVDDYILKGYTVVNTKRLLRYRTRIRVDYNYNVLVELVSKNKRSQIVGVFSKVREAEDYCKFLNLHDPIMPIIALNDLTSRYLESMKNLGMK